MTQTMRELAIAIPLALVGSTVFALGAVGLAMVGASLAPNNGEPAPVLFGVLSAGLAWIGPWAAMPAFTAMIDAIRSDAAK